MKHSKKLLALVMAMVMAFSLMAVTAAAYDAEAHEHECAACSEDDGIMPIPEMYLCPVCGKSAKYTVDSKLDKTWVVCENSECGYKGWL